MTTIFVESEDWQASEVPTSDDEPDTWLPCAMCGGQMEILGTLGNTAHGRCRHCGWVEQMPIDSLMIETC